jgi:tetratricopeptide (TPR) repeat protein
LKRLSFLLVLLISLPSFGRETGPVVPTSSYLSSFLAIDEANFSTGSSFDSFLKKLEKKRSSIKKEKDFVRVIFTKVHQEYLKEFKQYASFNDLFGKGDYNCLTGTILYALVLNHFEISYEVIETNYHIFLTVETKQGKILLEATDPLAGFVDNASSIEERIATYKQNRLTSANSSQPHYQFSFDLYKNVSLEELQGLLYYNKAVESFNQQQLEKSIQYLEKAHELYSSSRIREFSMILVLAVQQRDWKPEIKEKYLRAIHAISERNSLVASLTNF